MQYYGSDKTDEEPINEEDELEVELVNSSPLPGNYPIFSPLNPFVADNAQLQDLHGEDNFLTSLISKTISDLDQGDKTSHESAKGLDILIDDQWNKFIKEINENNK